VQLHRIVTVVGVLLLTSLAAPAADAPSRESTPMGRTHIIKEDYHGWPNTYRISNGLIEARVVTDIGPRIIDLRAAGGDNVLQPREGIGGTGEDKYVFRGGWRLWIAPERTETTYALDNTACEASLIDDSTLRVTAPPQPAAGIRKQVDVRLIADAPRLRITARIKNVSDHALTYAAWSLPVLRPGGRAFVPLDVGAPTAFDAVRRLILWSYTKIADPRYHFSDQLVEIDQAAVKAAAPGQSGRRDDESKIGVDSVQGWAAYLVDGTLFLKRFPHQSGVYPDGGAAIEVYSNHEFLELENLGPLTTIQPGEEIVLPEDWWLFTGVTIPHASSEALSVLQRYLARAPLP